MTTIPNDPFMLLSFINMKLRDEFDSLEALCDDLNIDKEELCNKLSAVGYEYSEETRRFW
jgi:hypothetical protein